ncbi:MAG TPA: signal peptide peptidase SppA [Thermoanaerobaculia bacterium]|nr:signal peptide peptidase SppA [Thermoanaerobaculia bacterium]
MKRTTLAWGLGGLGGLGLLVAVAAGVVWYGGRAAGNLGSAPGPFSFGGRVGVVDLEGIILSGDYVRETIQKFRDAPSVKAVVLRINSPGGGVAASQEIYQEVVRFRRETKKPVVVSMESVAASGGYYAAAAADHIVANPGTITGSIGVIVQWTNYADLLEWARLRTVTFKSGALKDAGNPTRALSDDERKFFDELISAMLGQFRKAVTDGRTNRLKPGAMDRLADGRVITGEEALALGFVDEIGDYRDAVDRAARLAGMSVPAEVWHPKRGRPGLLELLTGPAESSLAGRLMSGAPVGGGWNAFYLW